MSNFRPVDMRIIGVREILETIGEVKNIIENPKKEKPESLKLSDPKYIDNYIESSREYYRQFIR